MAAVGATAVGTPGSGAMPLSPAWLWLCLALGLAIGIPVVMAPAGVGRVLQPLRVLHPEWVEERIGRITDALHRFRSRPSALAGCSAERSPCR